jgi:hypothetical protein
MPMEEQDREGDEPNDPLEVEEDIDSEPIGPEGLGALGQLASAVVVVAVLILLFFGSSAVLRRVFG